MKGYTYDKFRRKVFNTKRHMYDKNPRIQWTY